MINDMIFFIVTAIAVLFALLTVWEVRTDPRGTTPPPSSHFRDTDFYAPSAHL